MSANKKQRHSKSKPIDPKFLVVTERVWNELLSIEHIGINSIMVVPLTKEFPREVFLEHKARMGF